MRTPVLALVALVTIWFAYSVVLQAIVPDVLAAIPKALGQ